MLTTTFAAGQEEDIEAPPDSQFESYYDAESGHWSLRRVPSSPPDADPSQRELLVLAERAGATGV